MKTTSEFSPLTTERVSIELSTFDIELSSIPTAILALRAYLQGNFLSDGQKLALLRIRTPLWNFVLSKKFSSIKSSGIWVFKYLLIFDNPFQN
jgi:hypothetical protein